MNPTTTQLLFIAVMIGAFWFLIMRPQQQRQRQQRQMLADLKAGDEIVTIGGIYATVVSVGDRVVARTAGGAAFELAPQAIANVVPPTADEDVEDDGEIAQHDADTDDDAEETHPDA